MDIGRSFRSLSCQIPFATTMPTKIAAILALFFILCFCHFRKNIYIWKFSKSNYILHKEKIQPKQGPSFLHVKWLAAREKLPLPCCPSICRVPLAHWRYEIEGPFTRGPKSLEVNLCNLSRWEHGSWDLPFYMGFQGPSHLRPVRAISTVESMEVGTYHFTWGPKSQITWNQFVQS